MNLYLVKRTNPVGYDEFDSAVIAEESASKARSVFQQLEWADDKYLVVSLIGYSSTEEYGVILGSFNAG